jgi:hypothetical protein
VFVAVLKVTGCFHVLHLEVKTYCDTCWGIIVKIVISIFSELIVVDGNMCVGVHTLYHNSTKIFTASQACVISKFKNLKQNIKMQ